MEATKEKSFYRGLKKQSENETITITIDFSCIDKSE